MCSSDLFPSHDNLHTSGHIAKERIVSEEEAEIDLQFEWELEQDELTHIHISSNIGGNDQVKIYTVTVLNTTTLSYKDDFGKSYTFTKTN